MIPACQKRIHFYCCHGNEGWWRAAGVLKKSYLERDKGYRCYEMILIVSDEERGVSIPGVLNWSTQSPPLSVGLCCELWREQAINY